MFTVHALLARSSYASPASHDHDTHASNAAPSYILSLPNELVLHALNLLTTPELLPLALISHRFHALVVRLIHARLRYTAAFTNHALILECQRPADQFTKAPLDCAYLGTPRLGSCITDGTESEVGHKLEALRGMYSSFRPKRRPVRQRQIPGDIPGSRTHAAKLRLEKEEREVVAQLLTLEDHESFTQLCASTNLISSGPRLGLFTSFARVHHSFVRVWKHWLAERAELDAQAYNNTQGEDSILWFDAYKHVGMRVTVREQQWRGNVRADEEIPVSYGVEYNGKAPGDLLRHTIY